MKEPTASSRSKGTSAPCPLSPRSPTAYPGRLEIIAADALELRLPRACRAASQGRRQPPLQYRHAATHRLAHRALAALVLLAHPDVPEGGRRAYRRQQRTKPLGGLRCSPDGDARCASPSTSIVGPSRRRQTSLRASCSSFRASARPDCRLGTLEQVTAAAFGQRRKMLRSSLKQIFSDPADMLAGLDIDPDKRAEQLAVADFCRIARVLEGKRGR